MLESWKAVGKRLAEARIRAGFSTQRKFAEAIGSSTPAVAKYEQGTREVPISVLLFLSEAHGINVNWIVAGRGDMFADPSKEPAPSVHIDPHLLRRLHRAARLAYKEMGQKPPDEDSLAIEAGKLYNSLLAKVVDVRNAEVVDAVIPVLVKDLKSRLAEANDNPGSGKLSAS